MSSNRRSRPPQRPYEPEDEVYGESGPSRRDPRRRTPYVPRQQESQPAADDYLDEPPPRRSAQSRRGSARQRPQQPPYRQRVEPEYDDYGDIYADDEVYDDRVIEHDRSPSRSSRRRGSSPAPGRRSRSTRPADEFADAGAYADEYDLEDDFDDGFIDEDDWYEEEAAGGGYRPRQRSARSVPRPSISVPRPTMPQVTLPRPTIPLAVRRAALAQDRESLALVGALVLSVIAMAVVTMLRVDTLAPGFATHISASGIEEDFRSEAALWQLPLMAGALLVMNGILAWFLAAWSTFSARFVLIASIIVQVVIWVALLRLAF